MAAPKPGVSPSVMEPSAKLKSPAKASPVSFRKKWVSVGQGARCGIAARRCMRAKAPIRLSESVPITTGTPAASAQRDDLERLRNPGAPQLHADRADGIHAQQRVDRRERGA